MRVIDEIIVHCSATRPEWFLGKSVEQKRDEIKNWHVKDRGWKDIGYALIIDRDGKTAKGRDLDKDGDVWEEIGAHVEGKNSRSIGLCLIGGFGSNADDPFLKHFTPAQEDTLFMTISSLRKEFPSIKFISGHNQYANKACPGFYVPTWYQSKQVVPSTPSISNIFTFLGNLSKNP